ncbi:MAG: DUF393 domain-containing protein [Acidobacteriota bacterium]|nr:DUF393 domain-containing protein [Acidobacteriota bacterium]MDE2924493.1 DUF393 domain-containing protein [Acidobacteriota bacterium]MDE3264143.1 DUF393 domain-containing protein [Acidobacteriota bacterium]
MDERRERRPPTAIVYYDGDCALCNWSVARCLDRGVPPGVRFAPQDGESFERLTAVRPDLAELDSMVLQILPATDAGANPASPPPGEIKVRSEAVLWLAARLNGPERRLALLARVAPRAVLDWGYRLLARNRRRVGSRLAECPVPTPEQRRYFLA